MHWPFTKKNILRGVLPVSCQEQPEISVSWRCNMTCAVHLFIYTLWTVIMTQSLGFVPANHRQLILSILDQLCDWRWSHLLGNNHVDLCLVCSSLTGHQKAKYTVSRLWDGIVVRAYKHFRLHRNCILIRTKKISLGKKQQIYISYVSFDQT